MQLTSNQVSKICKQIDIDGKKRIVMIDVMGDKSISTTELLSNIYCIDECNFILWQIKEVKTKPPFDDDGFVYLARNNNGEIIADRFSGFVYRIDPETGEAEQISFHK